MFYNIDSVCIVHGSKELGEIFISNAECALDKSLLKKLNITGVINAAEGEVQSGYHYYQDIGIDYLGLALVDLPHENISLYFDKAANFIDQCLARKGKVLSHCAMGISRSATIVVAYLIKYCGMDTFEAISFLRQKRGIINPNPGFIKQLQQFQKRFDGANKNIEKFCGCGGRPKPISKFRN